MRKGKTIAFVVGLAAVTAAVGAVNAWAVGSHKAGATVKATMVEWKMTVAPSKVSAGKVTFAVKNAGKKKHEFVVIKTNLAPNALPVTGGKASETGSQGEIEEVEPGVTKTLTLTLKPGKYVLICNLLRHYTRGQFAGITAS